ncbi:MAG TPA: nitroreductase family protein [Peptococcaceae bacterium]|jgi:nitroreductase|nr:nitroreductase [Clostridia bacterium]HOB82654.1 nitroreductase family protein [Peptococcaceae bacterium]HPZ71953.1 nitroreductase family protein [Peptococcaceae bacterium]HQD54570.1 nitroreductase family protein [Peptococcaceae bacterium]
MDLQKAIFERRSVRRFSEEPVPDEDLFAMIEAASWAPNAANAQMWHFVVVKKKEVLEAMAQAIEQKFDQISRQLGFTNELAGNKRNALFFAKAPVTIAVLMRPYESKVNLALKKLGLNQLEIQRLRGQADLQSIGAAIQNLLLTAYAKDYGACWMCAPLVAAYEIEKILGVEEPWELKALIPIGKPADSPGHSSRKAVNEIITMIE